MKSRSRAASRFVDPYHLIMSSATQVPSFCPYSHLRGRAHAKVNFLLVVWWLHVTIGTICFSILFGRCRKGRGGKRGRVRERAFLLLFGIQVLLIHLLRLILVVCFFWINNCSWEMLEADWSKSEFLNHHRSMNYHAQLTNKGHFYSSGGIPGGKGQVNIRESDSTGRNTLSCVAHIPSLAITSGVTIPELQFLPLKT